MKNWEEIATDLIHKSLQPIPHELNGLDWKINISEKGDRIAAHLSAFSNYEGGGFLVFGIDKNGQLKGINENDCSRIIEKIGNIARHNLEPSIRIDHTIIKINNTPLLIIYIQENKEKPVHIRGKDVYHSYIRSAGQTRRMTKQEVAHCIAISSSIRFEEQIALRNLEQNEILRKLDYAAYFDLIGKNLPDNKNGILAALEAEGLIVKGKSNYHITNLGAILFAKDLNYFKGLSRKGVRIIIYPGKDRLNTIREIQGKKGYASGFENMIEFINNQLPTNEIIQQALRKQVKMYPEIAIREVVANAIIHQDFYETGTGPMVEIFQDRLEVTNPGKPLISTMRFIDYPPQSRNEILASFMRRLNMCEERGSGIDKVIASIELFQLPAPDFIATEKHTKVILYSYRKLSEMDKADRVRACYQHCCLKYVSGEKMSNQSLRQRFNISDKNYPMASRIIADTLNAGLVKPADPESKSKKYAFYVPFWA